VVWDAGNANMNLVPGEDVYSEKVLCTNVVCESGDYPRGLSGPNEVTKGRAVEKNFDGGERGCPMGFASPNKERTDPLGRVQSAGRV
jgi:hypothetical protein